MKNLIIYLVSLIPNVILFKLENLFSISQGKGFSNPKKESRLILEYVAKKNLDLKTVFDIGCFHGDYTNEILKKFPNSSYFLFEPDENNFQITKKRFCNNENIKVFQYAISNRNEDGILYSYGKGSLQGSLIDQDFSHLNLINHIKQNVKIKRIDNLFEDFSLESIDFCKIDIEGNEMKSLVGMGEKIKKIKIIQFEFGPASIDSKTFFKEFYNFFSNLNFKIYRITPSSLEKISSYNESIEYFRVTNFVAINKNNIN